MQLCHYNNFIHIFIGHEAKKYLLFCKEIQYCPEKANIISFQFVTCTSDEDTFI